VSQAFSSPSHLSRGLAPSGLAVAGTSASGAEYILPSGRAILGWWSRFGRYRGVNVVLRPEEAEVCSKGATGSADTTGTEA
jgi:hypothetical protein